MDLKELKKKSPVELLNYAEQLNVENASTMNTQELIFFHRQDNTLLINTDWGSYCRGSNQAPLLTRCDPRWLRSLSPPPLSHL